MSHCSFCKKRKEKYDHLSFHGFPTDESIRNQWIRNIDQPSWKPSSRDRLCSEHFEKECFEFKPNFNGSKTRLKKGSIPTIFERSKENEAMHMENISSNPKKRVKLSDDITADKFPLYRSPLRESSDNTSIRVQGMKPSILTAKNNVPLNPTSTLLASTTAQKSSNSTQSTQSHSAESTSQPICRQLTPAGLNQMFHGINNDHTYTAGTDSRKTNPEKKNKIAKLNKLTKQKYARACQKLERCKKIIENLRQVPELQNALREVLENNFQNIIYDDTVSMQN
ncbi:THAP domain-containing protein 5-like [Fopius arisanus]|uniref:THAP domain-containing protein 5-like n=1 Tax=Fopius arisanus TaxID=64838 RepID=A0A9R1TQN6_9HYME|nr:PREDICTED: THAP domain-containing protein 5-like [Fopius arisanus]